ncbi:hypothetical protein BVRB_031100, partial [Beta vulgaris subsp. vulgaris]
EPPSDPSPALPSRVVRGEVLLITASSPSSRCLDEQSLEEQEEQEDRHDRQHAHGEQSAIVAFAGRVGEGAQAEHDRVGLHFAEIDQRAKEVVPGPDEGEDGGGRQHGHRKRNDDLPVDAPGRAAIHLRRLIELLGQAAEELHHQEDEEAVGGEELRHHQRQEGIDPAELAEQHILRDQRHLVGQHERHQHHGEPEVLELEVQPGKCKGRHRTGQHIADDRQARNDEAVDVEGGKAGAQAVPAADISIDAPRR